MTYFCKTCGYSTPSWLGRCPQCGEWNSFYEVEKSSRKKLSSSSSFCVPSSLAEMQDNLSPREKRFSTGLKEVDRVLGGGVVEGSLLLLSGDPGIGKSTLLLKIAEGMTRFGKKVLYVSSEESLHQIYLRVERLQMERSPHLFLLSTDDFEEITAVLSSLAPQVVIVDSIQNLGKGTTELLPGSVALIRELSIQFMEIAKRNNVALFLVGHVTKEGLVAGPKTLEHLVDVVLYLEGDPQRPLRMLRGIKNRFGSTQEVGILEMREEGLSEVLDPSSYFVGDGEMSSIGTVRTVLAEGKRTMMIEVQSLVSPSYFDFPRRVSLGLDLNRLHLLLAVLEKVTRVRFAKQDVYLSLGGGIRATEVAIDLAVCCSVLSSRMNKAMDRSVVYCGEVSLNGEIRPVSFLEQRVQEALRMGAKRIVTFTPHHTLPSRYAAITWSLYRHIGEALKQEGFLS
ncbi:MAG: DNA repair protein RadA [Atribacterota bacterium]